MAFSQGGIVRFPHLPDGACRCTEVPCIIRKADGGLRACEHDVGTLLRGSGQYSVAWLKKESHDWHPDRFGRKCDEDFRDLLCSKATELYAIIQTLMEAEGHMRV